jgi:hypothetical protein
VLRGELQVSVKAGLVRHLKGGDYFVSSDLLNTFEGVLVTEFARENSLLLQTTTAQQLSHAFQTRFS